MDPLDRLLALREINDLIGRYCMLFDDQDWDAFDELWTDDAAFVVDGIAFEGRDVHDRLPQDLPPRGIPEQAHDLATGRRARPTTG